MTSKLSRRGWLRRSTLLGAGAAALGSPAAAAPAVVGHSDQTVKKVEQIFLDTPFKEVPGRHQYREFDHE